MYLRNVIKSIILGDRKILISVALLVFCPVLSYSQNYDPPYPRIGQIMFYGPGAGYDIWKNHDLVIIRHYYPRDAKKIKEANPDIILLATNGIIGGPLKGDKIHQIIGKPVPSEWYLYRADGSKIPFWGDFLRNITPDCPVVDYAYGPQKFYEFAAEFLIRNTDWNYFDGSFFDTWISHLKWFMSDIGSLDLNLDGQPDGAENVNSKWKQGEIALVSKMRELVDKPILAHESTEAFFNGNGFEFWTQETSASRRWNMSKALELLNTAVPPRFNYANSSANGFGPVFRADFTSAQIVGAFFGHDEGTMAHRWTFLHDEYEANLGYPTSAPEEIESGLFIRYFDNGVLISNISGQAKTVRASDLKGGPYWRFLGQQDPQFNNGRQFDEVQFEPFDGIMLFKEPTTLATPIIIDNVEINMTSLGQDPVQYVGDWHQTTEGKDCYALSIGWGENSAYDAYTAPGNGENKAKYAPVINIPGEYVIYEWHGRHDNLNIASNVPFKIFINGSVVKTGKIDQTQNTGKWNQLGVVSVNKGDRVEVVLSNNANGYVLSDAIKFVLNSAGQIDTTPPNPPKNLRSFEKTENQIGLRWDPPDPASDGDRASRYIVFRNGQEIGRVSSQQFLDQGLKENTSYSYEVYSVDDWGNRSASPAQAIFSTLADQTPPEVIKVFLHTANRLVVVFNEAVSKQTAENVTNYAVDGGIAVQHASLAEDGMTVILSTTNHEANKIYHITVSGIQDLAVQPNTLSSQKLTYRHSGKQFDVFISADDKYDLYVNGIFVAQDSAWESPELYEGFVAIDGKNVIAVRGINEGSKAGLFCEVYGGGFYFPSNSNWKFSKQYSSDWTSLSFDDRNWSHAVSYGLVNYALPWANFAKVSGILRESKVHWIWSESNSGNSIVYFRLDFNPASSDNSAPNPPSGVSIKKR